MKTFSSNVLAELQRNDVRFYPYIQVVLPSGTNIYVGGKTGSLPTGVELTGRIREFPIITSKVDWTKCSLEDTGFTLRLTNQQIGDSWQTFLDEIKASDIHLIKVYLVSIIAGEAVILYKGIVERIDSFTEVDVVLSVCQGLPHCDIELGTNFANWGQDWPGGLIAQEYLGRMMPIIFGKITNCPTLWIQRRVVGELEYDLGVDDTSFLHYRLYYTDDNQNDSISGLPIPPNMGSVYVGDELIYYATANYAIRRLSSLTRAFHHTVAKDHKAGTKMVWWFHDGFSTVHYNPERFFVAGHQIKSISNIKVDGRIPLRDDYTAYTSKTRPGALSDKAAEIEFTTTPNYPDISQNTRTKKVYFNTIDHPGSDWQAIDVENIIEPAEGDELDRSTAARLRKTKKIQVSIKTDSGHPYKWKVATKSLGVIKSAKLVIVSKVNTLDDDAFDPIINPTDTTPKVTLKKTSKTFINYQDIDRPIVTGDLVHEYVYGKAFSSRSAFTDYGDQPDWYSDMKILGKPQFTWPDDYSYATHLDRWAAMQCWASNTTGVLHTPTFENNYASISLPSWNKYYVTQAWLQFKGFSLHNTFTAPRSHRLDILTGENEYQAVGSFTTTYNSNASSPPVASDWEPITRTSFITSTQIREGIKNIIYRHRFRDDVYSAAGGVTLLIDYCRLEYRFYPTDYGTKKTTEIPIGLSDWDDLDDMWMELWYPCTADDKELEVYEAYIEVKYYPYNPSHTPVVTCDVVGYNDWPCQGQQGEHPEHVLRALLLKWLKPKLGAFDVWTDSSFEATTIGEDIVDYYIDKSEKILDTLVRIAFENRRWLTFKNYTWHVQRRDDLDAVTADLVIDDGDILRGTFEVKLTSVLDLLTKLEVRAKRDYTTNSWRYTRKLTPSDTAPDIATKEASFDQWTHAQSDSQVVAQYYLDSFSKMLAIYQFKMKAVGLQVEPGDVLEVSYSQLGIENQKIIVLEVQIDPGNPNSGAPMSVGIFGIKTEKGLP